MEKMLKNVRNQNNAQGTKRNLEKKIKDARISNHFTVSVDLREEYKKRSFLPNCPN